MPIVMGVSFTFVTVLCGIAVNYGYPAAVGAVIVGGLLEGVLGLFAKYWRKFITPIVSAVVVTSIGFSCYRLVRNRLAEVPALPILARRKI